MANKFHVFAGETYHPGGGMSDYQGVMELEAISSIVKCQEWGDIAIEVDGSLDKVAEWDEDRRVRVLPGGEGLGLDWLSVSK